MFVSFDFDHDPMTLVVKFDIDIVKMDLSTENEVPSFSGYCLNRHTDRQADDGEMDRHD